METASDDILEHAKKLGKTVRFQEINEFERLDERVAWVNVYFHFLIGVKQGFIEFCPYNSPPLDDEWLALLWIVRPGFANEITKRLKHQQFAAEIERQR